MSSPRPKSALPAQQLPVYLADDFCVINGANLGDPVSFADELVPDDIYELATDADIHRLSFTIAEDDTYRVAEESACGTPGAPLYADCVLTMMPPTGETVEIVVLVEVDADGHVSQVFAAPLAPLSGKTPYTLVGMDRTAARLRMAQLACVSFTRGTRITMATGEQKPVEDIQPGDRVLTRDDGPQEVRWIGTLTMRAHGEFAPIVITEGTLNNAADLKVSPDHRLFIYQRHDHIGAGRSELLVRARHLVNGETVFVQEGGFVDYFQILFDSHQIIFAEGISAETMQADQRTRPVLPSEIEKRLKALSNSAPGSATARAFELQEKLLKRPDAVDLLRRASSK
ncbi:MULTISPECIES: Hint domain-containing protein [Shimia]|uniref:Hint domain-containing protein n=1 Tax=Shimia TaxID=573139 RepID=UPI001FB42501|nr:MULTISPECIES: Hint domain-containing protein [Shimia]MDV4143929.1 Hint domain-containing protein [Shimia sp. FJ5]